MKRSLNIVLQIGIVLAITSPATAKSPEPPHAHRHSHGKTEGKAYHHRFQNAEKWAKIFEDPKRDRWQKPDEVIALMALKPTMKVADIGSGTGYFAIRIAKQLPQGELWGIDIEPEMVSYLEARARREKIANVKSVLGTESSANLTGTFDRIFVCDTYHHIPDRERYFAALKQHLTAEGVLVIVDFKMGKLPVGPPEKHRIAPTQLRQELEAAGYTQTLLDEKTLPYQYVAMYRKAK